VARRDIDELRETHQEPSGILGPELIMKEDPHAVESGRPGPAQFGIDTAGIVAAGLKHLKLVDGV
jgi:hypothetical protein